MFEEDLRSRLTADTGVSALVKAASIAWGDRPQASALPGITLDIIAGGVAQHMTDVQTIQADQVQIDVWSLDRLTARNVREAVIAALLPVAVVGETNFRRGFVDRKASTFERTDAGQVIYRERIDFTFWHSSAA